MSSSSSVKDTLLDMLCHNRELFTARVDAVSNVDTHISVEMTMTCFLLQLTCYHQVKRSCGPKWMMTVCISAFLMMIQLDVVACIRVLVSGQQRIEMYPKRMSRLFSACFVWMYEIGLELKMNILMMWSCHHNRAFRLMEAEEKTYFSVFISNLQLWFSEMK